jgi:hypothetical protein
VKKARSNWTIIRSTIDVKGWMERTPSVEEARPGRCPRCEAASRPAGRSLGLWGHGLRERQQRGPLEAFGEPVEIVIRARRFLCRPCGAALLVVPSGVIGGRLFSAAAIGLALVLFGVCGLSLAETRSRVSPWRRVGETAALGWRSLRRWARAVRDGRLFSCVRRSPARFTARQVAERAALTLSALAPLALTEHRIEARVFAGAVLAG